MLQLQCVEEGEERQKECIEERDEGYSSCAEWGSKCCDWWPCSWGCKLVEWFCVAWTWVSNIVCVAWDWITVAVCVAWELVTTVVSAVVTTIESIVGWALDAVGFVVELILEIPFVGRFIKWVWNLGTTILWSVVSLGDAVLGIIGVRPEKKLRICTIILRDEKGAAVANVDYVVNLLQWAANILRSEANIRLIPLKPFQYSSGFSSGETVDESWVQTVSGVGSADTLDVPCNAAGFGADLGLTGTKFDFLASTNCFFGSFRRVVGYGAPVTCFVIRSLPTSSDEACGGFGCGLWITDYVTVRSQPCKTDGPSVNRRVAAHELGHSGNLWHLDAASNLTNLMGVPWNKNEPPDQVDLDDWQVIMLRASKHVTYF